MPEAPSQQRVVGQKPGSRIEELEEIQRSLEQRPRVSIRFRVAAVFGILFLLMCSITIFAVILFQKIMAKQVFFEKASAMAFEVQQARRFEKNFFLYGTNLQDAIANVHVAHEHFRKNLADLEAVIGPAGLQAMLSGIEEYQKGLEHLLEQPSPGPERDRIEASLRKHGAQIIDEAEEALARERIAMHSMLQSATIMSLVFLGFMVVALVFFTGFITQAVLKPLGRFMRYADRISAGDFSPITPVRKYRDEFSNLAMTFNRMLRELLHRQEQLVQSAKMAVVGNLTAGIAHELNNPLNNISLSVDALLDDFGEMKPEQVRHILEQIGIQVERASGTVRNLLDFTRREEQVFTTMDLNQALQTSLRLIENERRLAGIDVTLRLADGLSPIKGNPRAIEQVFLNLFLNAVQAMGNGGMLTVSSAREQDWVRVEVQDTGPGIAAEDLERIFEPFFTTKASGQGTGLGLSVTQGIIDKHGGRIAVSSTVGRGTTFTVRLPAATRD